MPVRQSAAYWLALGQVKGLGGVGFKKLASCFADPTEAFFVSSTELERSSGLSRDIADALVNFSEWRAIDEELRRAAEAEVAIVVGGTGSMRRHVQRIGRLLRPRPGKRALVYELVVQRSAEVSQMTARRRGLAHDEFASLEVMP